MAQYDGVVGHGVALSSSNTWLWHSNRVYAYGPYVDEPVALLDEDDGGGASTRPSVDQITGTGIYYLQRDRRYDVVGVLDDTGALQEQVDYDPFGELSIRDGGGTIQTRSNAFGLVARSRFNNLFAFTGRHWDDRAELYHFRARVYRQDQGRFLQRDPLGFADGINRYAYAGHNPLGFVDPSGTVSRSVGVNTTLHYESIAWNTPIHSELEGLSPKQLDRIASGGRQYRFDQRVNTSTAEFHAYDPSAGQRVKDWFSHKKWQFKQWFTVDPMAEHDPFEGSGGLRA